MKCQYCGCVDSRVLDSRPSEDASSIRRRRECTQCGKRFTTYETMETRPIYVIKKNGSREPFLPEKIRASILKACQKRSVPMQQVDAVVQEITLQVNNTMLEEIPTNRIGEMVMLRLKDVDEVAYVRFASVYRQFKDINTFMDELSLLLHQRQGQR